MLRLLALLLLFTCSDAPPTTPETRPVDNPNAGNTAIYDVDPDDPYEIGDGEFLDLRPGATIADFEGLLRPFQRREGDNTSLGYRIDGRGGEELGQVRPDSRDTSKIGEVMITSPDVVTKDGLRVGNSKEELIERIGSINFTGEEATAAVFATKDKLTYRLESNMITAILIRR